MVNIPDHETWYCIECQEKGLIWDPSQGSSEDRWQHDYINMYLEQKEKFARNLVIYILECKIRYVIILRKGLNYEKNN
ncbi:hypothetical protein LCGC14_0473970 [marine sediment metagenome]|uniref:Uncharacterized protein n=1 Tax=marine sediment metagenome TaxID=412755 RepID=A0A0F9SU90_9ZZZZ|nr:hypothetical protein [bacterium]